MKTATQIIYVGGPTVIIEIGGLRIITDPTLDPPGDFPIGPNNFIKKLSGPAIKDIGHIDLVLLSHDQHDDNLDKAGRKLISEVPQTFSTKAAAERLQGTVIGMEPWETRWITTPSGDDLAITATPARHGPTNVEKLAGDVIGFVLTIGGQAPCEIYLTGDTVFFDGIKSVASRFHPKYILIFAGAAKPGTPFNLTMGSNDAIDTAFTFPDAIIIPVHYEGWSHLSEPVELLQQSFGALGIHDRLKILKAGELTELV